MIIKLKRERKRLPCDYGNHHMRTVVMMRNIFRNERGMQRMGDKIMRKNKINDNDAKIIMTDGGGQ